MSINLRRLAARGIVFLGPKLILAEFAAGALLSTTLGVFVLLAGGRFGRLSGLVPAEY